MQAKGRLSEAGDEHVWAGMGALLLHGMSAIAIAFAASFAFADPGRPYPASPEAPPKLWRPCGRQPLLAVFTAARAARGRPPTSPFWPSRARILRHLIQPRRRSRFRSRSAARAPRLGQPRRTSRRRSSTTRPPGLRSRRSKARSRRRWAARRARRSPQSARLRRLARRARRDRGLLRQARLHAHVGQRNRPD